VRLDAPAEKLGRRGEDRVLVSAARRAAGHARMLGGQGKTSTGGATGLA
jgi:hypothetical protein